MRLNLTSEQMRCIKCAIKSSKTIDERVRLSCIFMIACGESKESICKYYFIDQSTFYRYIKEYIDDNKTKNDKSGGSSVYLDDVQLSELIKHLSNFTYLKIKDICVYVKKEYGVDYSISGMHRLMHQLGFVYKKPVKYPSKLNFLKQQDFINSYYELKSNLKEDEKILFLDSVHPEYQSQAVFGWIKKGSKIAIPTTAKQFRVHYIGAINASNPANEIAVKSYDTINGEAVVNFLEYIDQIYPNKNKLYIILDNASYHKGKEIKSYLAKNSNIQLRYLPPYSPNLNAIERLWKIMREFSTYNQYYATFNEFKDKINDFFTAKIPKISEVLNKRINDKFQIIQPEFLKLGGT